MCVYRQTADDAILYTALSYVKPLFKSGPESETPLALKSKPEGFLEQFGWI